MVDPVSGPPSAMPPSFVPLPPNQTIERTRDPLPVTSNEALTEALDKRADAADQTNKTNFEDYLNNTSITTAKKATQNTVFDPVSEIENQSAYIQPGQNQAI